MRASECMVSRPESAFLQQACYRRRPGRCGPSSFFRPFVLKTLSALPSSCSAPATRCAWSLHKRLDSCQDDHVLFCVKVFFPKVGSVAHLGPFPPGFHELEIGEICLPVQLFFRNTSGTTTACYVMPIVHGN